ncbi:hypothetical protein V5O48_014770 [Marasmius crinis-equi]|uniref:Uncharacterized protein n=1 Tax=Marasmius crinis-equi TaxID=585013 RepID=A0ABR3EWD6_9AGAR
MSVELTTRHRSSNLTKAFSNIHLDIPSHFGLPGTSLEGNIWCASEVSSESPLGASYVRPFFLTINTLQPGFHASSKTPQDETTTNRSNSCTFLKILLSVGSPCTLNQTNDLDTVWFRNSDAIKLKKKIARAQRNLEEERKAQERRFERQDRRDGTLKEISTRALKEASSLSEDRDPLIKLRRVHDGLEELLAGQGLAFIEELYREFVEYLDGGGDPTSADVPTSGVEFTLYSMAEAVSALCLTIMRDYGVGRPEITEADWVLTRIRHILGAVTNLPCRALAGDLKVLHDRCELSYQIAVNKSYFTSHRIPSSFSL